MDKFVTNNYSLRPDYRVMKGGFLHLACLSQYCQMSVMKDMEGWLGRSCLWRVEHNWHQAGGRVEGRVCS